MGKNHVEIFLRVRPSPRPATFSKVDDHTIAFHLPRDEEGGLINNQRREYEFKFDGVLPNTASQEDVFRTVAEKAVVSAVEGYNATIFAYGQTGSGKTWSITGGINRYEDRGIIPRSLSRCFKECQARPAHSFQVKISYMEIYNETCYDLLDPKHEGTTLEDLPKVQIREGAKGNLKFVNLHKHLVNNEEEALNLLFLGDTNRMICETPMNKASSRSHCVFTVLMDISNRPNGAAFVRKSKFHLVDLAGSERIGKTGVHGQIATEAKYINLSLHYLEQVIITLQENPKGHVPYRNSKVTSVLRDSLGGNCRTSMIAAVNLDDDFSLESIATCKFAARVAMIANDANINEHTDPKLVIAGLRQQIDMLKAELRSSGKEPDEPDVPLSVDDLAMIAEIVRAYVNDKSPESTLALAEMRKVRESFIIFKNLVWEARDSLAKKADFQQVDQLKGLLATRDHELAVLVKLLKKMESGRPGEMQAIEPGNLKVYSPSTYASNGNTNEQTRPASASQRAPSADVLAKRQQIANMIREAEEEDETNNIIGKSIDMSRANSLRSNSTQSRPQSPATSNSYDISSQPPERVQSHTQIAQQPHRQPPQYQSQQQPQPQSIPSKRDAFDKFKLQHPNYAPSQENHAVLKEKYALAKEYAELVNQSREKINGYIALIEQLRVERAMQRLTKDKDQDKDKEKKDQEEERTKALVEKEKAKYKETCDKLQQVKSEIETLQALIKNTNSSIQKDFISWYNAVYGQPARPVTPAPPTAPSSFLAEPNSSSPRSSVTYSPSSTTSSSPSPSPSPRSSYSSTTSSSSSDRSNSRPSSPHVSNVRSSTSSSSLSPSPSLSSSGPMLTGNKEADEEILKFCQMRNQVRKK